MLAALAEVFLTSLWESLLVPFVEELVKGVFRWLWRGLCSVKDGAVWLGRWVWSRLWANQQEVG